MNSPIAPEPQSGLSGAAAPAPSVTRIRLWDGPTRFFHWALVLAVATAIVTGEIGAPWMDVHAKAGLVIIGLLVFRLVWGVLGSTYARFGQFFPTPGKVKAYLAGRWQGFGHNPLGAVAVLLLLGLLLCQAVSGLFANDDIDFTGPLFNLVTQEWSNWFTHWHHRIADILFWLLGLHVAAIVFYVRIKKKNLVQPMLTGWQEVESTQAKASASGWSKFALLVGLIFAIVAVFGASGKWL